MVIEMRLVRQFLKSYSGFLLQLHFILD